MQTVNENLKKLKIAFGFTQMELAEEIEVTRSSVSAYMEGRADVPVSVVKRIFEKFDLPKEKFYDFFFDGKFVIKVSEKISRKISLV